MLNRGRAAGPAGKDGRAESRSEAAGRDACRSGPALASTWAQMISDTTFLSDLHHEREIGWRGPALRFLARHRGQSILATVISVGELAVIFPEAEDARRFLANY